MATGSISCCSTGIAHTINRLCGGVKNSTVVGKRFYHHSLLLKGDVNVFNTNYFWDSSVHMHCTCMSVVFRDGHRRCSWCSETV